MNRHKNHYITIEETPGFIRLDIQCRLKRVNTLSFNFDKQAKHWRVHIGPGNNRRIDERSIHNYLNEFFTEKHIIDKRVKEMGEYKSQHIMTRRALKAVAHD